MLTFRFSASSEPTVEELSLQSQRSEIVDHIHHRQGEMGTSDQPALTRRSGRRGATMAEFAFLFIVFLLLTIGLMELGRGVWTYTTVAFAAREGVRFAMVHGASNPITDSEGADVTDAEIENVINARSVGLDASKLVVNTSWTPDRNRGSIVEVQVLYPFDLVTGSFIVAQSTIQLGSRCRMIVAR